MGLHPSFNTSASWGTNFKICTRGLISKLQTSRRFFSWAALPALWTNFHRKLFTDRFAELGKRDGLSQRAIQKREAFLSENKLAMGTTPLNPASKPLQSWHANIMIGDPILCLRNLADSRSLLTFPLLPIIPRHLRQGKWGTLASDSNRLFSVHFLYLDREYQANEMNYWSTKVDYSMSHSLWKALISVSFSLPLPPCFAPTAWLRLQRP